MFRYRQKIFNKSDEESTRALEDDLQKYSQCSEEEKVEFILQQWQRYMLIAHQYQVEKLIH